MPFGQKKVLHLSFEQKFGLNVVEIDLCSDGVLWGESVKPMYTDLTEQINGVHSFIIESPRKKTTNIVESLSDDWMLGIDQQGYHH